MGKVAEQRAALRGLDVAQWRAYLTDRSGLPGPRGNIELALAVAEEGELETFQRLIATDDEYLTFCGVVGLGTVLAHGPDGSLEEQLRGHAADTRWRVREAVAMALQRLGGEDAERLYEMVRRWSVDADPLVQRAAIAGICEPRLLGTERGARAALAACADTTASLSARPRSVRRDAGVRTLRQGLGYCWSVAVAADPAQGLAAFRELGRSSDPDIVWVVRENSRKKRLAGLL